MKNIHTLDPSIAQWIQTSPFLDIVSFLLPFIPSESSFDSSWVHLCNRFFTFHSQSQPCQLILNLLALYMRIFQPIYRVHEVSKCISSLSPFHSNQQTSSLSFFFFIVFPSSLVVIYNWLNRIGWSMIKRTFSELVSSSSVIVSFFILIVFN